MDEQLGNIFINGRVIAHREVIISLGSIILMLDNSADIRFIQQMLGHVRIGTTQIYGSSAELVGNLGLCP